MKSGSIVAFLGLFLAEVSSVAAFLPASPSFVRETSMSASRRDILDATMNVAAWGIVSGSFLMPSTALADESIGDLSMPTPEEDQAAQEAAMAEKLRRKAELQKKASKSMNFQESLKGELRKKEELNSMSKEEKRNRLCEELGRGC